MRADAPSVAIDETITEGLAEGAHVVFSLSGGKDSSAAAFAVDAYLDTIGHPRERRHAIHADLGIIEWLSTPEYGRNVRRDAGCRSGRRQAQGRRADRAMRAALGQFAQTVREPRNVPTGLSILFSAASFLHGRN